MSSTHCLKVTQISRGSTTDGPGFRTVVFFKGCPLRCDWCHNPETQSEKLELMFDEKSCIDCKLCYEICPVKAISSKEKGMIDRATCEIDNCLSCVNVCPTLAIKVIGREYNIDELMTEILKDSQLFINSSGGVTFSGGEPLFQNIQYLCELMNECQSHNIPIAVDTCGAVPFATFQKVLPFVSLFLYDIKHTNNTKLKSDLILNNLMEIASLKSSFNYKIWIRIPLIPSFNYDDMENIGKFINSLPEGSIERINILPFHRLPENKYIELGRSWELKSLPEQSDEEVEKAKKLLLSICTTYPITIGG